MHNLIKYVNYLGYKVSVFFYFVVHAKVHNFCASAMCKSNCCISISASFLTFSRFCFPVVLVARVGCRCSSAWMQIHLVICWLGLIGSIALHCLYSYILNLIVWMFVYYACVLLHLLKMMLTNIIISGNTLFLPI